MRILLTGHKGLVGNAILSGIDDIIIYEERINNLEKFCNFLRENNIDTIIHCAGKVGGVKSNFNNQIDFYLKNSNLNNIVFEAAVLSGVKNLFNFSSTCVFPDKTEYPILEDYVNLGPPHFTNETYAYSKRMMQLLCKKAKQELGLNYITLVPTNIYGPNDNFNLENGHVAPSLIHKCFLAKESNTSLSVWGDGTPEREFVYVGDVVKIIKTLLTTSIPFDSVILSNSSPVAISTLVENIVEIFDFKNKVIYETNELTGQIKKPTNNQRLLSLLDKDFKFTPINVGLENTIAWFKQNYPNVRI